MAKRRICPACGKTFQAGKRVMFASRTGLRGALVCQKCVSQGTIIVQDRSADMHRCIECETNAAVMCLACVAKKINQVKQGVIDDSPETDNE